jgi:hypothetical protein
VFLLLRFSHESPSNFSSVGARYPGSSVSDELRPRGRRPQKKKIKGSEYSLDFESLDRMIQTNKFGLPPLDSHSLFEVLFSYLWLSPDSFIL